MKTRILKADLLVPTLAIAAAVFSNGKRIVPAVKLHHLSTIAAEGKGDPYATAIDVIREEIVGPIAGPLTVMGPTGPKLLYIQRLRGRHCLARHALAV